jgi:hypothetical protein
MASSTWMHKNVLPFIILDGPLSLAGDSNMASARVSLILSSSSSLPCHDTHLNILFIYLEKTFYKIGKKMEKVSFDKIIEFFMLGCLLCA